MAIKISNNVVIDDSRQLNVIGISTISNVLITTVGTGATIGPAGAGIVTYYGDGSQLQNVISGIGINTEGGNVGYGATILDFRGSGISTVTVSSGVGTIYIEGGTGGGGGGGTITDETSSASTFYPNFTDVSTGTASATYASSGKLEYQPSTGTLRATIFTSLSDETQKTNIQHIENAIEITKQLNGVTFNWKDNNQPSLGLIAQEVEKILPEAVNNNADGIKSVNYSSLVGLLVEAIKEQEVRIQELEKRLNA